MSLYLLPATVVGLFQQGLPGCTKGTEPFSSVCAHLVRCLATTLYPPPLSCGNNVEKYPQEKLVNSISSLSANGIFFMEKKESSVVSRQEYVNQTSPWVCQNKVKILLKLIPVLFHAELYFPPKSHLSVTIITLHLCLFFFKIR